MHLPIDKLYHPWPSKGTLAFMNKRTATHHHRGVDLVAPKGTPVFAVTNATVVNVVRQPATPGFRGYGRVVVLRLDLTTPLYVLYAHLDTIAAELRPGSVVTRGQQIATVGDSEVETSGAHLHLEFSRTRYPQQAEAERIDPGFFFEKADS